MKIIRKVPEPPKAEPMPGPAEVPRPEPMDASAMLAAVQALHAAADRIQQPTVEVRVPQINLPAAEKPKAFTVTITKRDSKGRALEFDVRVKNDEPSEEPDAFTAGYNGVKQ